MQEYIERFGPLDPAPPVPEAFGRFRRPPPHFVVLEFWGLMIYWGMRQLLGETAPKPGKGWEIKALIRAYFEGDIHEALVWVDLEHFSVKAQREPVGPHDMDENAGRWYPCIVAGCLNTDELVPFWCPRLALDKTKARGCTICIKCVLKADKRIRSVDRPYNQ